MSKVGKQGLSMAELEDEFLSTVSDYRRHVQLLDKKAQTSSLSFVFSVIPQVVASLALARPSEAFAKLAEWRTAKIDRLKAEMAAKGNELAFISAIERAFRSDQNVQE
jgi:hypothetical protein